MDQFVIVKQPKENDKIIGRDSEIKNIKSLIDSNTSFCIYGDIGVGKTFLIEYILTGINYVEISSEMLKSDFLEKIKNNFLKILIYSQKQILESW